MARQPRDPDTGSPAQQDEADVFEEVGAERDESGELLADEARIRALGAVDAESVIENRRLAAIVGKKRSGKKEVPFNAGDILTKYETLIKFWPANTIDIGVKRLTGAPVQHLITSRPRSAPELFEALKLVHGQYEEAKYEIKFFDNNSKEFRGNGQITMPDTRPPSPQQGQPMHPYYPYGPAPAPPGYPPLGYPPQPPLGYAPQQPTAQGSPQQPPVVHVQAPASPDLGALIDGVRQVLAMVQSAPQPAAQQWPQQQPVYAPPPQPPPEIGRAHV